MKLNIGCGQKKLRGYINVDINPSNQPDMVLDITKDWPWDNDSVDEILLDNVVEHLEMDIIQLSQKAKKVLKPNGYLKIICPNCFDWRSRLRYLFGEFGVNSGFHYDHRWLYKPSWLKELLEYNGFSVNKVSDLFDNEVNIIARKRS